MDRVDTTRALTGAGSSMDISREMLMDYYKHFHYMDDEARAKIFSPDTRGYIAGALRREWDATYNLLGDGYNHVECPIGGNIYRIRRSKLHMEWQEKIDDNIPKGRCIEIINECLDKWEAKRIPSEKRRHRDDDIPF